MAKNGKIRHKKIRLATSYLNGHKILHDRFTTLFRLVYHAYINKFEIAKNKESRYFSLRQNYIKFKA